MSLHRHRRKQASAVQTHCCSRGTAGAHTRQGDCKSRPSLLPVSSFVSAYCFWLCLFYRVVPFFPETLASASNLRAAASLSPGWLLEEEVVLELCCAGRGAAGGALAPWPPAQGSNQACVSEIKAASSPMNTETAGPLRVVTAADWVCAGGSLLLTSQASQ